MPRPRSFALALTIQPWAAIGDDNTEDCGFLLTPQSARNNSCDGPADGSGSDTLGSLGYRHLPGSRSTALGLRTFDTAHANPGPPVTPLTSAALGAIATAGNPRAIGGSVQFRF